MSTLTEFHLFPNLPSELRLKVWGFVHSPRTVYIKCRRRIDRSRRFADAFISEVAVPATLHICRESRQEALSIYKPHFKTAYSPKCIYISFERDTVKFPDGTLEYLRVPELHDIQRMVLEVRDCTYFGHFNMDILQKMKGLKDLEIITEEAEKYSWSRGGRFLNNLVGDFEDARTENPGWECPKVRVFSLVTGGETGFISGGALIFGFDGE
jgi:hypothetical protein